MKFLKQARDWTMQFPAHWGFGRATVHSSLLLTVIFISSGLMLLSLTKPGFRELRTAAISLPIVWICSLAVRVASQHLAIGSFSLDLETKIGPTGNLSSDYEYLPSRQILSYALAGQLATAGLILLGLIINAAMAPTTQGELPLSELFDFRSGWSSRAWASQIMWVNVFIGLIHFLPTIPFDGRAAVYAILTRRSDTIQDLNAMRKIANVDSHIAAVFAGISVTLIVVALLDDQNEVNVWYAAAALAVYLMVANRWENARAAELESQYQMLSREHQSRNTRHSARSHFQGPHIKSDGSVADFVEEASQSADNILRDFNEEPLGAYEELADEDDSENPGGPADRDDDMRRKERLEIERREREKVAIQRAGEQVDEILRKLHQFGNESLTDQDREILVKASEDLNHRRKQSS